MAYARARYIGLYHIPIHTDTYMCISLAGLGETVVAAILLLHSLQNAAHDSFGHVKA